MNGCFIIKLDFDLCFECNSSCVPVDLNIFKLNLTCAEKGYFTVILSLHQNHIISIALKAFIEAIDITLTFVLQ